MHCKGKFINLLAVLLIGFAAVIFSLAGISETSAPIEVFGISVNNLSSEPLAYLFQILFILFIISPPLIVVLLFLIWKELKERNKMK